MNKKKKALRTAGYIFTGIIFVFAISLLIICNWAKTVFNVSLNEILFTLKSPLRGTDTSAIKQGLRECIPQIISATLLYVFLKIADVKLKTRIYVSIKTKRRKLSFNMRKIISRSISLIVVLTFVTSLIYADAQYQIVDYIKSRFDTTTVYEDYYIHPDDVNIRANGDEKNLICIYLESLETTYASTDVGGAQPVNYIPNLTRIANENISFSSSDKLGGFHSTAGNTWTVGAILSTTGGIPFSFPTATNAMSLHETFASGLTNLGDILERFGYNQYFLCGSDAGFGGRRTYFRQHGNYNIFDLHTAREQGYIPEDYFEFWGYEDKYLYEIAKNEITQAYELGKPFNYTMLTVDTHNVGGYICELCENNYDFYTANVISCADRQINQFIEWCKSQPFYESTSIILIGDHPRMDTYLVENIDYYDRTMYNCFINCEPKEGFNNKNRNFTPMDMFPTILSAMNFEYDGNKIGLGTDMFSDEPTLAEELGFDFLNNELAKYSQYYIDNFS